jgi:hypothetical protein
MTVDDYLTMRCEPRLFSWRPPFPVATCHVNDKRSGVGGELATILLPKFRTLPDRAVRKSACERSRSVTGSGCWESS